MATTLSVNLLNMALGLFSGILTARVLGPDDRGILVALVVWFGTVSAFSMLALDDGIVFTARGGVTRAVGLRQALHMTAVRQSSVGSVVMLLVGVSIAAGQGDASWVAAIFLMFAVPMNNVTLLALGSLRAAGRFDLWNTARVAPQSLYCFGLLMLLSVGQLTVVTSIAALTIANFMTMSVSLYLAKRLGEDQSEVEMGDEAAVKRYGRRLFGAMLPAQLNLRLDQMILGVLLAPSFLGLYAVAVSMVGLLQVLGQAVEQVLFPRLAGGKFARDSVLRLAGALAVSVSIGALVLAFVAAALIDLLYGSAYEGATRALQVLAPGAVFVTLMNVFGADAKAHGNLRLLVGAHSAGVIVTGVLLVPFVHIWGIVGASLVSVASYSTTAGILFLGHVRNRSVGDRGKRLGHVDPQHGCEMT